MARREGKYWRVRITRNGESLSTTRPTKREAEEVEAAFIERHRLKRAGKTPEYTIEDAINKWIDEELPTQKARRKTANHVSQLLPYIQGLPLTSINEAWNAYKKYALSPDKDPMRGKKMGRPRETGPLSPSTINKKGAVLRSVANLAFKEWQWLDRPITVSLLPEPAKPKITIKKPEFKKFLKLLEEPECRALFNILFYSGFRIGEILRVRVIDGYFVIFDSKNGTPHRVKIHPALKNDIKYIPFPHKYHYYYNRFVEARRKFGRPELTPHKLRHSFASHLLNVAKVDLKTVSQLLNHSSISITADMYGDMYTETLDKAIDSM